ncbi:MAG: antitoxin Xre-like helix-turn-helix domain-containing protein [Candidatus Acidiferrales bacterium]
MRQTLARKVAETEPAPAENAPRTTQYGSRGASLGLGARATGDLIHAVQRGLPFKALEHFAEETGLSTARIASLIEIPERTLARRRVTGRLGPDESERLLRVSGVYEKTVQLFDGDMRAALNWLTTPKKALGNRTPLEYSRFDLGARDVETMIGRLEHGVFA